jgi:ABC-type antimicrobial peptide transport system permease subunit
MERIDPDLPLDRLRTMSDYVADALAESRLNLILMSLFGGAALLLSSVGIYGVFSYSVGQRTREIGIRMALGQEPGDIRNMVLKEGAMLIAKSTVLGLGISFVLASTVSSLLYQVSPGDPMTFGAMALVLMAAALAGCYIPARRATAVSPLVALKVD